MNDRERLRQELEDAEDTLRVADAVARRALAAVNAQREALRAQLDDAVGTLTSAVHVLADAAVPGKTLAQRPDERERFQQCAEALAELQALRRRLLGGNR